jgi:acyl carrier protein
LSQMPDEQEIRTWLISKLSESLQCTPDQVDIRAPFASYGLKSIDAVHLVGNLEEWLNVSLSPLLIWDYPTIQDLAKYLARQVNSKFQPTEGPKWSL